MRHPLLIRLLLSPSLAWRCAQAQGLAKVTELPSESGCCAHSGGGGGAGAARPASTSQQQQGAALAAHPLAAVAAMAPAASPAPMAPQQLQPQQQQQAVAANPFLSPPLQEPLAHHAAADDEVSACGEHNHHQKRQTDAGASAHHSPSEGNTSLAVVPDMGAQGGGAASAFPAMGLPSQDAINAKAPWATAFDVSRPSLGSRAFGWGAWTLFVRPTGEPRVVPSSSPCRG